MGEAVTAAELLYGMPLIRSVTGDGGGVETGGCGALLVELKQLWGEIGKSREERERMVRELEAECMRVYRRKVDEATGERAMLHQSLAAGEAEIAALTAALGSDNSPQLKVNKWTTSLTERVSSATALLEELRAVKAERSRQFADIRSEIEKITAEIAGRSYGGYEGSPRASEVEEHDLTIRRLNEYKARLTSLQKEKSDRLHRVLEHVTEVHSLCDVLGEDFIAIVNEVHPGLHETSDPGRPTSISDSTLSSLAQVVAMLASEKAKRAAMLREAVVPLVELWELMDSSEEERRGFRKVTAVLNPDKVDALSSGVLSVVTIKKTEEEVERLTRLKAGRMKELVLKRRLELENICRSMHVEPDASTVPEKSIALIDSGLVNPSELMASIDEQIAKAREELQSRREIMEKINKWLLACEEEKWLEEYNMDENRFSTGRIARLNLKRAEKARLIITKIPAVVDNLISRTLAWESERKKPFLYDGARLVAVLEEHKQARIRQEEERRRLRGRTDVPQFVRSSRMEKDREQAATRRTLCGVRSGRCRCCSARCGAFLGGDWAPLLLCSLQGSSGMRPRCFARRRRKHAPLPLRSRRHRAEGRRCRQLQAQPAVEREQKKLRTLLSEKEAMPHLKRPGSSFGRAAEPCNVNRKRVDAGRFASSAPSVRSGASSGGTSTSTSSSSGASATEVIRPRSSAAGAGQCGEFFKGARRLSAPPFKYVAVSKGSSMSSSLALS